jgi:DNA-binding NarL/FixJ family response regulator
MNIAEILIINYPGTEWTLVGSDYKGLDWLDSSPKPTEKELQAQWPGVEEALQAEQDAKIAARQSALAKLAALGLTEDEIAAL